MSNVFPIQGEQIDSKLEGIVFNNIPLKSVEDGSIIVTGRSGSGKKARAVHTADVRSLVHKESGALYRAVAERTSPQEKAVIDRVLHEVQDQSTESIKAFMKDSESLKSRLEAYSQEMHGEKFLMHPFDAQATLYSSLKLYGTVDSLLHLLKPVLLPLSHHKGYVGDGVIRHPNQVEPVLRHLQSIGHKATGALLVHAQPQDIINRTVARMACKECKIDYNALAQEEERRPYDLRFDDEAVPHGNCRYCEGVLTHRNDDKPEGVKRRLREFEENGWDSIRAMSEAGLALWITPGNVAKFSDIPRVTDASYACRSSLRDMILKGQ